jgi:hypothetical protein
MKRESVFGRVKNRHPGESRDPVFQPMEKTWTPAFAGVTTLPLKMAVEALLQMEKDKSKS